MIGKEELPEEYQARIREKDDKISELQAILKKAETAKMIINKTNKILDEELYRSTIITKVSEISAYISEYNEMVKRLIDLISQVINFDVGVLLLSRGVCNKISIYINNSVGLNFINNVIKKTYTEYVEESKSYMDYGEFKKEFVSEEPIAAGNAEEKVETQCVFPLSVGREVFGVIALGSRQTGNYTRGELETFNLIAKQAAIVVDDAAGFEVLKEFTDMKSKFLSTVSHELRTPLTAIREGIGIILDGSTGQINEDQESFLDTAKRNVDRLYRLINEVLDFAKLESGKMEFNVEKNNIKKIIAEVVDMQKTVTEKKGLYLNVELEENLEEIYFDSDKIIQVLTNLINNAIKFTDEGGITVKATKNIEDESVLVSIKDSGSGIKEEDIIKLFVEFQQVGADAGKKTGSTGLGLAICKKIVNRHKGKIWVESQYGNGTEFLFTLPAKKEA